MENNQFRTDYRTALLRLIRNLKPNYFLTLNFNMDITSINAKRRLKAFAAMVDRKLLGPQWSTYTSARMDFIFFPEHVYSNLHLHGLGTLPMGFSVWHLEHLDKVVSECWRKVVPSGTTHLRRFLRTDLKIISRYSTKELRLQNEEQSFVLTREFWRRAERK